MSYKLSYGLILGIAFSHSAYSQTQVPPVPVVSRENIKFYKDNVGKCKNFKDTAYMADYYINMVSGTKNIYIDEGFLSSYIGCDQKFIKDFKKKIANDNVEYYKYSRNQIKEEIKKFEDKGLTGNYMVKKYMDYAQSNDVDLEADPEMEKTYLLKKEAANKRKESCSDKMNLKEPLSIDRPRNQDSIGWCYAFTAADLISNELGKDVSAAYTATRYNDKFWTRLLKRKEGGFADEAANELINNGVCLEKDMPSGDYSFSTENDHLGALFKQVKALNAKYSPQSSNKITPDKKMVTPDKGYTKQQVYVDLCTQNQATLIQLAEVFPHLNLNQLAEALMKSGDNSFSDLAEVCPIDLDPKLKKLEIKTVLFNSKKIYKTLDEQLEKGKIVGIGYRSNVLSSYKKDEADTDHASSIVGRRFNEKTLSCEYLLRNSWGTSCANYGSEYECKNGHIWVGEEFLKYNNAVDRVDYVETK